MITTYNTAVTKTSSEILDTLEGMSQGFCATRNFLATVCDDRVTSRSCSMNRRRNLHVICWLFNGPLRH